MIETEIFKLVFAVEEISSGYTNYSLKRITEYKKHISIKILCVFNNIDIMLDFCNNFKKKITKMKKHWILLYVVSQSRIKEINLLQTVFSPKILYSMEYSKRVQLTEKLLISYKEKQFNEDCVF